MMNTVVRVLRRAGLVLAAVVVAAGNAWADAVPRAECFPFERLPAAARVRAEAMLLEALDREALYTVIGGMKPISNGGADLWVDVAAPSTDGIEDVRRMLSLWTCGSTLQASLLPFADVYEGRRPLQIVIAHRPAVRDLVAGHPAFFGALGITPSSQPVEIVMAVEFAPKPVRYRGYGRLFGYPDEAVTFFVDSATSAGGRTTLVPRDFRSVPTFARATHQFVYAVPRGAPRTAADDLLTQRAAPILAGYRARRARYIGEGLPGVVEMLRDWFDVGEGRCDPTIAEQRAVASPPVERPIRH